jgi:hypothetical protein
MISTLPENSQGIVFFLFRFSWQEFTSLISFLKLAVVPCLASIPKLCDTGYDLPTYSLLLIQAINEAITKPLSFARSLFLAETNFHVSGQVR